MMDKWLKSNDQKLRPSICHSVFNQNGTILKSFANLNGLQAPKGKIAVLQGSIACFAGLGPGALSLNIRENCHILVNSLDYGLPVEQRHSL